jgi:hypothetical protein
MSLEEESAGKAAKPGLLARVATRLRRILPVERAVRWSCVLALAALGLIVVSLLHPSPLAVVGAMSVGQVIGTLSLSLFVYAVLIDLRSSYIPVSRPAASPPDEPSPTAPREPAAR